MKIPHVILFGPPGAGKSTQTTFLIKRWPIKAISTGKMLREEVASGSELGQKVQAILARGELVDDDIMIATIHSWLQNLPPDKGFLLDGFPRNIPQAEALDEILVEVKRPLTAAINLHLNVSEALSRLGGRRICYGVGAEEIIHINDETAIASCIKRGGLLVQRPDDLPNVIVHRLNVYEAETNPLLDFYQPRGIVHNIDATGTLDDIAKRITQEVENAQV